MSILGEGPPVWVTVVSPPEVETRAATLNATVDCANALPSATSAVTISMEPLMIP